jgi:hypothetical protein
MAESSQVFVPTPTKFLGPDASDDGWGATLQGRYFPGGWLENEPQLHIDAKRTTGGEKRPVPVRHPTAKTYNAAVSGKMS